MRRSAGWPAGGMSAILVHILLDLPHRDVRCQGVRRAAASAPLALHARSHHPTHQDQVSMGPTAPSGGHAFRSCSQRRSRSRRRAGATPAPPPAGSAPSPASAPPPAASCSLSPAHSRQAGWHARRTVRRHRPAPAAPQLQREALTLGGEPALAAPIPAVTVFSSLEASGTPFSCFYRSWERSPKCALTRKAAMMARGSRSGGTGACRGREGTQGLAASEGRCALPLPVCYLFSMPSSRGPTSAAGDCWRSELQAGRRQVEGGLAGVASGCTATLEACLPQSAALRGPNGLALR